MAGTLRRRKSRLRTMNPSRSSSRPPRFQFTLPVWGATRPFPLENPTFSNFNPRSPCGERLRHIQLLHALLEFQSTLPVWGATNRPKDNVCTGIISIHAPRVGSDIHSGILFTLYDNFNPRSPCGERRIRRSARRCSRYFNPRSPCGERLDVVHAASVRTHFNPRSPCGERRALVILIDRAF